MIIETILALWPVTEIECLALNVYHEARGESPTGQLAVAHVTINRLATHDSLCEAVWAHAQFSWTLSPQPVLEPHAFAQAVSVALIALQTPDTTDGATHYFAHHIVTPYWADILEPVTVIENHTFMKE